MPRLASQCILAAALSLALTPQGAQAQQPSVIQMGLPPGQAEALIEAAKNDAARYEAQWKIYDKNMDLEGLMVHVACLSFPKSSDKGLNQARKIITSMMFAEHGTQSLTCCLRPAVLA
jgi:hypothetical protein